MKRTITSVVVLALLAVACGSDDTSDTTNPPSSTTAAPDGPPAVLLQVAEEGGFMMIEFVINRPPTYTLLTDGTLIFQGPQPGVFPGPVMPTMQQTRLTEDQMQDIRVLIEATGLPGIDDFVDNEAAQFVADATSTVATYFDDSGMTHRMSVYALGLTDEVTDELANLMLLREKLGEMTFSGAGDPYATDEVIVHVIGGGGVGAEFNDVRPWDFAFEPGIEAESNNQFPCQVLGGEEAAAIKASLADATQATQWEHDTGTFTVVGRHLIPGEAGCE